MKSVKKYMIAAILALVGIPASQAAESGDAVLVTANPLGGGATELVIEYLSEGSSVGIQFELEFRGIDTSNVSLDGCGGSSQLEVCRFKGDRLKYAVVNSGLSPLESRVIATVTVPTGIDQFEVVPVQMLVSDANANEATAELLVDFQGDVRSSIGKPGIGKPDVRRTELDK